MFCRAWSGSKLFANVIGEKSLSVTVNSEIFARILFSRIALKDIFAT